jgi:hypothetical protein
MQKVLIQLWETLNEGLINSDGCSLHIDVDNRNKYLKENKNNIERPVGIYSEIDVNSTIFKLVDKKRSIRLSEIEFNNLIGLGDIIPIC